jgi:hypothetical protein
VLSSVYLARLALSCLRPTAAVAARQSIFSAVAVAHHTGSPVLLDSARTACVHGMDVALVVSGAVALVGVVLTVVFLPRVNAPKAAASRSPRSPLLSQRDRPAIA